MSADYFLGREKGDIKVLIVDDEPGFLELAEIFLKREDERLDVRTTTSPVEGLEVLENEKCDVTISDYKMPEMDGIEFLKAMREVGWDIPFIILTGKGHEEAAMKALNLGADRYLKKEEDPEAQCRILADVIVREIEEWHTERESDERNRLTKTMLDSIPIFIYSKDKEGRYIYSSSGFYEQYENYAEKFDLTRPKSILGKTDFDLFLEEHAKTMYEDDMSVMRTGKPIINKLEHFSNPVGPDQYTVTTKVPRFDEKGNVFGLVGSSYDISNHKRREEELKEEVNRYMRLFEDGPDGVYLLDSEGFFDEVNEKLCRLLGRGEEEIIGTNFKEAGFLPEESIQKLEKNFKKGLKGVEVPPFTVKIETDNGKIRIVEINSTWVSENGGPIHILGFVRDITKLRGGEESNS